MQSVRRFAPGTVFLLAALAATPAPAQSGGGCTIPDGQTQCQYTQGGLVYTITQTKNLSISLSGGGPPPPPPSAAATVAFTGKATGPAGGATQTYNLFPIGAEAPGRYVACAVTATKAGGGMTVASLTIGGVAASKVVPGGAAVDDIELWAANVPTGTAATIAVNWNGGTTFGGGIGCWALNNLQNAGAATAFVSGTANAAPVSLSSVPAGGVVIAASINNGTFNAWTGAAQDYSFVPYYGEAGASAAFATAQTNYNVTASYATVSQFAVIAASFR